MERELQEFECCSYEIYVNVMRIVVVVGVVTVSEDATITTTIAEMPSQRARDDPRGISTVHNLLVQTAAGVECVFALWPSSYRTHII